MKIMHREKLNEVEATLVQMAEESRQASYAQIDAAWQRAVQPVVKAHNVPDGLQAKFIRDHDGSLALEWEKPELALAAAEKNGLPKPKRALEAAK